MAFDCTKRYCWWFREISRIPRGSRHEQAISDRIVSFAKEHGFAYHQDAYGNVTVDKPASPGYEQAAPLILQAHMDMVNVKSPGSPHDFDKDPLDLYVDEEGFLHARDTTLGADDGVGVAYMLAILEDDTLAHPPLECIFTVMEEIGLVGAQKLRPEDIRADRLICLDGGGETKTGLSSAGGADVNLDLDLVMETNQDPAYRLHIGGLSGGHSGGEIHKEKGNADVLAVRILEEARARGVDVRVVAIKGGSKDNAIPTEAEIVFTSKSDPAALQESLQKSTAAIDAELEFSDPGFQAEITPAPDVPAHADEETSAALLDYIYLMPNGFQHRSMAIEGLTLTSLNLGIAETTGAHVHLQTLTRSALDTGVDDLLGKLKKLAERLGLHYSVSGRYPGWNYKKDSPMREKYAAVLARREQELTVEAGHGGNECGVWSGLHPGIDIITFGPIASGCHTTEEKLDLASFDRSYEILCEIVASCRD